MVDKEVGVSTHVLDTARGKPAAGVPVQLERQEVSGQWRNVGSGRTDEDGRCFQLLSERDKLTPGTYRLNFDTEAYYAQEGVRGLHPVVQISFWVRDGETHLHIPLLLSPHGYTTYRGS